MSHSLRPAGGGVAALFRIESSGSSSSGPTGTALRISAGVEVACGCTGIAFMIGAFGAGVLAGVIACTDGGSVAGMAFIIGASAAGVLAGAIDCADGDSAGFPEISAAAVCAGSGGGVACTNARTEL